MAVFRQGLAHRRAGAALLGAGASLALAWPVHAGWGELAQTAPPWSPASLLATAAGGGAVCALALVAWAAPPDPDAPPG